MGQNGLDQAKRKCSLSVQRGKHDASYELIDREEGIFKNLDVDEEVVNKMIMEAREKSFS